jgi:geranylgeranyl diphosphate synthase, type I
MVGGRVRRKLLRTLTTSTLGAAGAAAGPYARHVVELLHDDLVAPFVPGSAPFRADVQSAIGSFLAGQRTVLEPMGPGLVPVADLAAELLSGGKRLRPAFCVAGFLAVAGQPEPGLRPGLLAAAASLELLHVSALVYDDVMDASDLRRGRPTAHRQFEQRHRDAGWLGDPAAFGRASAILLGDLLLMWSAEMLRTAPLPAGTLAAAAPVVEAMRTEVTGGQYLDVLAQVQPLGSPSELPSGPGHRPDAAGGTLDLAEIGRVVEFKSARYSVQRPCQVGAALGGGDAAQQRALAAFGIAAGRAFQYRDDLLGVFGDPATTGKPAGDDLREGKRTVLVAHAFAATDDAGRRTIRRDLGDPELDAAGVERLRSLIVDSGAQEAVEQMIAADHRAAMAALGDADLTPVGRDALLRLAAAAVTRTS